MVTIPNPYPQQYKGLTREQASRKAAELIAIASKTGQSVLLFKHLKLLAPMIEG